MLMRYMLFFICFIKSYVAGTHLNCLDIRFYKEVDKSSWAVISEMLDCTGVCVVIRSNTVRNTS